MEGLSRGLPGDPGRGSNGSQLGQVVAGLGGHIKPVKKGRGSVVNLKC